MSAGMMMPAALRRDGLLTTLALDLDAPALRRWALETTCELERLGCLYEHGRYAPTPICLPQYAYRKMLADVRDVLSLARRVATQTGKVLEWARPDQRALVEASLALPLLPPIARPDGIVVDGQLKLLELNLDSGLGGYFEVELLQQRLALLNRELLGSSYEVPTVWSGLQQYIEALLRGRGLAQVNIAVMVGSHISAYNQSHAQIFVDQLARGLPGVTARVVAPQTLRRDAGWITDGELSYDILWRFGAMTHAPDAVQALVAIQHEALQTDSLVVSSPADLGVDGKLVLASLSQLADDGNPLLSAAERDLVKRLVPWTRCVERGPLCFGEREADMMTLALAERKVLVLKRSHSKSSQQVFIGCETEPTEWLARIKEALVDPIPWILQHNMRSAPLSFGYLGSDGASARVVEQSYSINPFIFGDAVAAPFIRIERDERNRRLAIANVTAMATCGVMLAPDASPETAS